MQYDTISLDHQDDYLTITLDRPIVKNALNAQMRAELLRAVKDAPKDARALVITGAGDAFCSGQDLGDGRSVANIDLERVLRDEYEPLLRTIYDCPIPTGQ